MHSLSLICAAFLSLALLTTQIQAVESEPYNEADNVQIESLPKVEENKEKEDRDEASFDDDIDDTKENQEEANSLDELDQEDNNLDEEMTDIEQEDSAEVNQDEVPIELDQEPVELDEEQVTDVSSEGFSEADEEFDKSNSKVQFQALIRSQSTKCTCYCRPVRARSCAEIKRRDPTKKSGYYNIVVKGKEIRVFCNMGVLCGSNKGWMRVIDFNMNRRGQTCPPTLQLYTNRLGQRVIRHCGRKATGRGQCPSVILRTRGVTYSRVCGKVIGYQYRSTDGSRSFHSNKNNINGPYIDGVSITRGYPRKHVWSFVSALYERGRPDCPCYTGAPSGAQLPSFAGNNYYCESGFQTAYYARFAVHDPLWDGRQCGRKEIKCCRRPNIPWFYRNLRVATTDHLELRVCCDEGTANENVSVGEFAFYIM